MTNAEIKNLTAVVTARTLEVKFLSPTNNHGDMVSIKDTHYNKTIKINFDYSFNHFLQVAVNYLINERDIKIKDIAFDIKKGTYYITIPFKSNKIK